MLRWKNLKITSFLRIFFERLRNTLTRNTLMTHDVKRLRLVFEWALHTLRDDTP